MSNCPQNMGCWLKLVCLVGVAIWAVPLVWYSKQKKNDQAK